MRRQVSLLPHQMAFLRAKEKFVWLCAGLGAGKSYVLAHYIIYRMLTNPETIGLVCAATYSQLRDSILAELFRQLDILGLSYNYSTLTGFIHLKCNNAKIKVFSLENYEVLRGIEVGWIAIDEACLAKEEAYKVAIGRLRCRFSKALECRMVSTPRGYDHLYDRFVGEKWDNTHKFIHATALDNPYLPDGYLASLVVGYDARMYKQEVLAEFVSNAEGSVYHAFDRTEHVRPTPRIPGADVWVGMDFNVNPMTATLGNYVGNCARFFNEIYLTHSNTFEMCDELKRMFPNERIKVVPDATGRARKTSSTQSDHAILRAAGFEVITSKRNPPIEDRYNTMNGRLLDGRISIDPKCSMLIRDLERVTHEDNPAYLTHISDAAGYFVWHVMPIKRARVRPSQIQL